MKSKVRLGPILVVSFLAGSAALAQAPVPAWGTGSTSSEVISAWDLQPDNPGTPYALSVSNNYRYQTGPGSFFAGVHVPNGARIVTVEIEGCDSSATGSVNVALFRTAASTNQALVGVSSGVVETPGCGRWSNDLAVPEIVNTQTYNYVLNASNFPFDGSGTIGGIRIYYDLQVSPAPATARFGDVPTGHPFFQFIEALAASGITVGCGSGNFCPDDPVKRGEMAVFLAKALGLHWPVQSQPN